MSHAHDVAVFIQAHILVVDGVAVFRERVDDDLGHPTVSLVRDSRGAFIDDLDGRIRPYRPQTNGKAERFILTAIREWAYARAYRSSAHRSGALPRFMQYYNTERPHLALGSIPPLNRLAAMNNVRVNDT